MNESFSDRLRRWSQLLGGLFSDKGARAAWVLLFLVLLALVAAANPSKLLVFAWLAAKIIGASLIAVALFRTWDVAPESVPGGIESAMAHTRRVTLMAAAIVAAAFAP